VPRAWDGDGSQCGETRLLDVVRAIRALSARELATRIVIVKAFSTIEQFRRLDADSGERATRVKVGRSTAVQL
jgi:hypothetical protein